MGNLTVKKNYLTNNRCYQRGETCEKIGIQVHTIGTGQGTAASVADYWNQPAVSACVHYVCDADVPGYVLQLLPETYRSWADAGWGNNNLISIEICESDHISYTGGANYIIKNEAGFKADILRGYHTTVQLCAKICKERGWNPLTKLGNGMPLISSHNEGRLAGLSSGHVDPDHVWSRLGLTMDGFRKDVKAAMLPESRPTFKQGKRYRMTTTMALRTEPKASAPLVQYDTIPEEKRRYFRRGSSGEALIQKGTVDKCLGEQAISSRGVYMKITRGWILARYRGKNRVKKV